MMMTGMGMICLLCRPPIHVDHHQGHLHQLYEITAVQQQQQRVRGIAAHFMEVIQSDDWGFPSETTELIKNICLHLIMCFGV